MLLALSGVEIAIGQLAPPPQAVPNGPPPIIQQRPGIVYGGSVPSGAASPDVLSLSMREAIQRGLKYNLGVLTNQDNVDIAAVERRRSLSALLPNVYGGVTQHSLQNDLVAFGLNFPI